jgi:transcriptional regulator with XRE-family HTH domain
VNDEAESKLMPDKSPLDARRGDSSELSELERSNLGRIMKVARRAKGYSQAQVAVAASCTPQAIGVLEQGKFSTSPQRLAAIGRFLDVDIEAAKRGASRPASAAEMAVPPAEAVIPPTNPAFDEEWMSVLGTVDLGGGAFALEPAIAQIRRPPGLRQSKLVVAFNVTNDNMYPRFKIGELVYIQQRIAAAGDDAVIELRPKSENVPARSFIVEVRRMTADKIICRQHNPPSEIEFHRADVKRVYRVQTIPDLFGR